MTPSRRLQRLFSVRVVLVSILALVFIVWPLRARPQGAIQSGHPLFANLNPAKKHSSIIESADAVCKAHHFKTWRKPGRKVYDLIVMTSELDMLEIRLQTLHGYVDHFVIVESGTTLTDNWTRFKEFHSKIIHKVLTPPGGLKDEEAWLRDSLLTALEGTKDEPQPGDALIVSAMNEIVRPETAMLLRYCDYPARLTLQSQYYHYSYQWQDRHEQWAHPQATVFSNDVSSTLSPQTLRMDLRGSGWAPLTAWRRRRDRAVLWNAGWHCSFCFPTIEQVHMKMDKDVPQSLNTPENRDPATIIKRVRTGLDLFGRPGSYHKIQWTTDVPEHVVAQFYDVGRLGYLLDRSVQEYADFTDGPEKVKGSTP